MKVPPKRAGEIPNFTVGDEYSRLYDIHMNYGGGRQGGISPSADCPAIFVFTGDSGEQYGYKDGFDSAGVFSYSGEGQAGDMVFRVGNKALRDHAEDGRAVYLFEALGKGKPVKFMGEFVVADYSMRRGVDKNNTFREVIVFHLARAELENSEPAEATPAAAADAPVSLIEARRRAIAACSAGVGISGGTALRKLHQRSKAVRDYVLMRSAGNCESCGSPAPFSRPDGNPYLEPHHTTRLSDGGVDHPRHVIALCPTCHRKVHYGLGGAELNTRLIGWLIVKEPHSVEPDNLLRPG